eukprot:sb/3473098/
MRKCQVNLGTPVDDPFSFSPDDVEFCSFRTVGVVIETVTVIDIGGNTTSIALSSVGIEGYIFSMSKLDWWMLAGSEFCSGIRREFMKTSALDTRCVRVALLIMVVQPKRLNERLRCHVTPTNTIVSIRFTKKLNPFERYSKAYTVTRELLFQIRDF